MTCRVTTYTYSRPLRALKAFVRDRKTYGQYHASATRKMPGTKYQLVVVARPSIYSPSGCVEWGTLSLWSILLCILWIIPLDIFVKGTFHIHIQAEWISLSGSHFDFAGVGGRCGARCGLGGACCISSLQLGTARFLCNSPGWRGHPFLGRERLQPFSIHLVLFHGAERHCRSAVVSRGAYSSVPNRRGGDSCSILDFYYGGGQLFGTLPD